MSIFRRIWFNLFAFFLGTSVVWIFVLFFSQSGTLTASVGDAFAPTSSSDTAPIQVISDLRGVRVLNNNEFSSSESHSFRVSFVYNPDLDTSSWVLESPYPHTITFDNGEGVMIITLPKSLPVQSTLANLLASVDDAHDQIIVQSITWYTSQDIQDISFHASYMSHTNKNP